MKAMRQAEQRLLTVLVQQIVMIGPILRVLMRSSLQHSLARHARA
ncbi:hypothetical protein BH11PSE5_BH11PSE5_19480 [soil metagenome]|tara:strand:- start:39 stop:173 length:135 start_codon:yes stop_codon:yes gene_type:complete